MGVFDEVFSCFGTSEEDGLREQAEKSLANKGFVLLSNGRFLEALAVFDAFFARPKKSKADVELSVTFWKMKTLLQLGREAEALELCDRMMEAIGATSDLSLKEKLADALLNKASVLKARGDFSGELATYDALLGKYGAYPDDGLLRRVIVAEQCKIEALTSLGRYDDAISTCDNAVSRFDPNRSSSELRENTAWALISKGMLLGQKGDVEEALGALSEAIRRFGPTSAKPAEIVGRALIERAGYLCDLGRNADALTDCDDFLVSYDGRGEAQVSEFVAQALLIKGLSLANLDKIPDAVETLEKTVARFSGEVAEPIASFTKQAEEVLRELRGLEDEAC